MDPVSHLHVASQDQLDENLGANSDAFLYGAILPDIQAIFKLSPLYRDYAKKIARNLHGLETYQDALESKELSELETAITRGAIHHLKCDLESDGVEDDIWEMMRTNELMENPGYIIRKAVLIENDVEKSFSVPYGVAVSLGHNILEPMISYFIMQNNQKLLDMFYSTKNFDSRIAANYLCTVFGLKPMPANLAVFAFRQSLSPNIGRSDVLRTCSKLTLGIYHFISVPSQANLIFDKGIKVLNTEETYKEFLERLVNEVKV